MLLKANKLAEEMTKKMSWLTFFKMTLWPYYSGSNETWFELERWFHSTELHHGPCIAIRIGSSILRDVPLLWININQLDVADYAMFLWIEITWLPWALESCYLSSHIAKHNKKLQPYHNESKPHWIESIHLKMNYYPIVSDQIYRYISNRLLLERRTLPLSTTCRLMGWQLWNMKFKGWDKCHVCVQLPSAWPGSPYQALLGGWPTAEIVLCTALWLHHAAQKLKHKRHVSSKQLWIKSGKHLTGLDF